MELAAFGFGWEKSFASAGFMDGARCWLVGTLKNRSKSGEPFGFGLGWIWGQPEWEEGPGLKAVC